VHIHFLSELEGWGVTETQIVRTNDGGLTWHNVTPPGVTETGYSVYIFALDANHFWMQASNVTDFHSGSLYRTTDGGLTWSTVSAPFSGVELQFLDANNGWALAGLGVGAGSNAVSIFQTTDGGATWKQTYTNDPNLENAGESLPLGGIKNGLTPLNMQTAWVTGTYYGPGTIYFFRTDDSGKNWNPVNSLPLPPGAENAELNFEQVEFVTAQNAFMTMRLTSDQSKTAVYTSNDAGNTWLLTPTLIPGGGSADFLSAEEMVMYNGEQFYITRDAARTWSIIPPDVNFGETFATLDFVNALDGWVVTIDPATNQRTLYRTRDGGATWLPVIP
jgi:photosystem II stability/assembly factor-like uncharacterized protein